MLFDMPVGTPIRYIISRGLDNFFGFAYAEVECPKDIHMPFLPVYLQVDGKERLVFPTGRFKGYYFSEELKYAVSLGYKVTLINGYEFTRDNQVFKEYVKDLYDLKRTGNTSERIIFKNCLNSLYGRMGRRRQYMNSLIIKDRQSMTKIEQTYVNVKPEPLFEEYVSYTFEKSPHPELKNINPTLFNTMEEEFQRGVEGVIGNIAIAAAISAYARIEIDKYKRLNNITCYYTDNDSVVTDKPMPAEHLGEEIGKMKNVLADSDYTIAKDSEYFIEEGVFIRDKVYSLKTFKGENITKFSGLSQFYITDKIRDSLFAIVNKSVNTITTKALYNSKNSKDFSVQLFEVTKTFKFEYSKRIELINDKGEWYNTKPIHIQSIKEQHKDFVPLIGRQSRKETTVKHSLKYQMDQSINHYNVYNSDYKFFDKYYLNYQFDCKNLKQIEIDAILHKINENPENLENINA